MLPDNLKLIVDKEKEIKISFEEANKDVLICIIDENDEVIGEVTSLFCELRGLEANTDYCFTVTAANDTMESEKSEPACAKTLDVALPDEPGEDEETTTLAAPVVTATASNDSTIVLTWDAVEGAKTYNVYQGMMKLLSVVETTHTVTGLQAGREYCFTVTAVNSYGESEHSNEECATTPSVSDPDDEER